MIENTRNIFRKLAYKLFLFIGLRQNGSLTYQTQIAKDIGKPLTTINYHITKFKQEGLIDNHLNLTDKGSKTFRFLWENVDKTKLRAHNIQIKFNVIKCPAKFPDCFCKTIYQPLTNKKYRGLKAKLNDFTVMFYSPRKIICVLKDIYADSKEEIISALQITVLQVKEILEKEFEGIKIAEYETARIQTMHIAVLNSIIAKKVALNGFTYEGKDIAIDNSKGKPEIEATNPSNIWQMIEMLIELEKKERIT